MARDITVLVFCLVAMFVIYSAIDKHQREQSFAPYARLVSQSHKPRVLHFSMVGCPACAALEPSWKKVAAEYAGRVQFETIMWRGSDPYRLMYSFGVHSFPTLIYIDEQGKYKGRDLGAISDQELEQEVSALLNKRQMACNSR